VLMLQFQPRRMRVHEVHWDEAYERQEVELDVDYESVNLGFSSGFIVSLFIFFPFSYFLLVTGFLVSYSLMGSLFFSILVYTQFLIFV
jgi:hypothetical protein